MKRLITALVLLSAVTLGSFGLGQQANAQAAPGVQVSLGDSFASGTGATPASQPQRIGDQSIYEVGTGMSGNHCYKSNNSYPVLVAAAKGNTLINATCSGAVLNDILNDTTRVYNGVTYTIPAQIKSITSDASLVTVTNSGNDYGFGAILQCFVGLQANGSFNPLPCPSNDPSVVTATNSLPTISQKIKTSIAAIKQKAPNAKVVWTGYPQLLPNAYGFDFQCAAFLQNSERIIANNLEVSLNNTIKDAVTSSGATYVDSYGPTSAFQTGGRSDMCALIPKINNINPTFTESSAHPFAEGQQAYSRDVLSVLN